MTEPVKIITFGGAKFDANQVASKTTVNKGGKTYYVVNFKTGAKVQYPAQAQKNEARIDVGRGEAENYVGHCSDSKQISRMYDNMIEHKPGYENFTGGEGCVNEKADQYTISQFWGLEFTGSRKPDNVHLNGCTSCTVNLSGGNSYAGDRVGLRDSSRFVSQNNEVIMDDKDVTKKFERDSSLLIVDVVKGAGTHHEGDSRDKLQ